MPEFTFQPEHKVFLDQIMQTIPLAVPGKMFGYPGYKVNGKLAVGLFDSGIIAKVGAARAGELITAGKVEAFEPMPGRVWKDWVLVTGDFEANRELFQEAVVFVEAETNV